MQIPQVKFCADNTSIKQGGMCNYAESVAMRIAHNGENVFFLKQGSLLIGIKMITLSNPDRSAGCLCRKMAAYVPEIDVQNLSLLWYVFLNNCFRLFSLLSFYSDT